MQEILYQEVPTPDTKAVRQWLQQVWQPSVGLKSPTPDGIRLHSEAGTELSIFTWSLQRSTYLKIFRWGNHPFPQERRICRHLAGELEREFPLSHPQLPEVDLSQQSIFAALAPYYPKTAHFFEKMPQGEYDLLRAYWWEKRWREHTRHPQKPKQVLFNSSSEKAIEAAIDYDLIYIGGALGAIHAAVMARLGYRVLLVERLRFGRMNREWNISRRELQCLQDLGLFSQKR